MVQFDSSKVREIHINDKDYPRKLKALYNPPAKLYIYGKLPDFNSTKTIGIIGQRYPSEYGVRVAGILARDLVKNGVNIISGMARGIDYSAGLSAVNNGGTSIAVLGSGLDVCYPKQNMDLYNKLLERGTIISEYSLGTEPLGAHFPERNRIIAGLADGLLVVEAGSRSGTAITVALGLEMGKQIFAIPGRIYDPGAQGPNELIKLGAIPVTSVCDIMENI